MTSTDRASSYCALMANSDARAGDFAYDVALSFAGQQRPYEKVAAALRRRESGCSTTITKRPPCGAKSLYEHLDWIYQKAARYCVLLASERYAKKVWTTHERRSAQAQALQSNQEYVLPVRFDDTEILGLRPTVVYLDARSLPPAKLAHLISEKLGPRVRAKFFPPEPDKLFSAMSASSPDERNAVERIAVSLCKCWCG